MDKQHIRWKNRDACDSARYGIAFFLYRLYSAALFVATRFATLRPVAAEPTRQQNDMLLGFEGTFRGVKLRLCACPS
jgi:hypothetical protein